MNLIVTYRSYHVSDTAIHTSILSFFPKLSSVFVDPLAIISAVEANN